VFHYGWSIAVNENIRILDQFHKLQTPFEGFEVDVDTDLARASIN
jgi:hypothetical protein